MEYCEGGDLLSYLLRVGGISERKCRLLFLKIAEAVRYLHSRNICHRDIKLENILLDAKGDLKLSDFGLCSVQSDALMGTPCGSASYVSPEIIAGSRYDGRKSDVWAAGIVLYMMVARLSPWKQVEGVGLLMEIAHEEIEYPWYFNPALKELLAGMLQKDPARRLSIDAVAASRWLEPIRSANKISKASSLVSSAVPVLHPIRPRESMLAVCASKKLVAPTSRRAGAVSSAHFPRW